MKKIRVSKIFEKTDATGRVWFNQAITVDQFPHENHVEWVRATDPKYLTTPGVYEADTYYVTKEYQSKDGRKVKDKQIRFENLKPVLTVVQE